MATQIAKKISMKALVGTVSAFIPMREVTEMKGDKEITREVSDDGATEWLAEVIGLARTLKHGTSNFGEWTALMGDFYAKPLVGDKAKNDTRFRTGQLFLPDVALNLVSPIVETLDKGAAVQVAFRIGITANSESNFGYDYTASFLMEPEENDPLAMMMNKVQSALTDQSNENTDEKGPEEKPAPKTAPKK